MDNKQGENIGEMHVMIESEIQREPLLKGSTITVEVKPGEIVLSGCVDNFAKKAIVKKTVKEMDLHLAITDNILVLPHGLPIDDFEIVESIRDALQKNLGDASANAIATSNDGFVELSGHVKWSYQKELAVDCISEINGIKDIRNNVTALTTSEEVILRKNIVTALKIAFTENIIVEVQGTDVILEGLVKSKSQIKDIVQLVKSIAGVVNIRNYLLVES